MSLKTCCVSLLLALTWVESTNGMMEKHKAMEYLAYFGYMPATNESMYEKALMDFQNMFSLTMTGTMNEATDAMMRKPRCGMPDRRKGRNKRYAIHGSFWRLKDIEYRILYPDGEQSKMDIIDNKLMKAFKEWSDVTGITFTSTQKNTAHLNVSFDYMPPVANMTIKLGLGYYPIAGGNIFFNGDRDWFSCYDRVAEFYATALHEIGHSLGLGHSKNRDAIMYPINLKNVSTLTEDDKSGIQILYRRH